MENPIFDTRTLDLEKKHEKIETKKRKQKNGDILRGVLKEGAPFKGAPSGRSPYRAPFGGRLLKHWPVAPVLGVPVDRSPAPCSSDTSETFEANPIILTTTVAPLAEDAPCHWPGTLAFLLFFFVSHCFSLCLKL